MSLSPGTRLGPYEILGAIGAGGMGEVVRARDTKLGREVAIKVLPAALAQDADRVSRFRREAQILATLNHPNIAAVFGLEESATAGPGHAVIVALVMEFVAGEDLAERLRRGAIPVDEALGIARQIAEAVEEAHEHGVVHRDLKPANVKVTPEGKVKVLDFGLAKALEGDPASRSGAMTHSPTMSQHMTEAGIILGTAAYMSPEQARGKTVDRRSDVWSFGVVLFEMLTGARLFTGETTSDVLARVLMADPDWNLLPVATPEPIRKLLRRCLARDPRNRLRDIGEARIGLEEYQSNPAASVMMSGATLPAPRPRWKRSLPWASALVFAATAAASAWLLKPSPAPVRPLRRFALPVEKLRGRAVISPDAKRLAYVADDKLWVRELDQLEPRVVAPVQASTPFWSPDSQNVAYVFDNKLWRVAAHGGSPSPVAPLSFTVGGSPGGAWTADDRIVFACSGTGLGMFEVSAEGGAFRETIKVDPATESDLHQASLLPDGRSLLFVTDLKDGGPFRIELFAEGRRKVLLNEAKGDAVRFPVYSPTGHILYQRTSAPAGLWAVAFSLSRMSVEGEPFLVAPDSSLPSIANDGTLLHRPTVASAMRQLAFMDSSGKVLSRIGEPLSAPFTPRLSPDGRRVAFTAEAGPNTRELFVMNLPNGVPTRLTFSPEREWNVEWMPSGQRVIFDALPGPVIYVKAADGTGQAEKITEGSDSSGSPDGKLLVYTLRDALWSIALEGDRKPVPFLAIEKKELGSPAISPDGRFVAYVSAETGEPHVFLRPYPQGEAKWQISTERAVLPRWNRRGDRLYFVDFASNLWEVEIETRPAVNWKTPRKLFASSPLDRGYDLAADGRILALVAVEEQKTAAATPSIILTENWFAEFKDKKKK